MVISWTSAKGAWPGTSKEGRRNRSKAEIEERRKAALIRRAGYMPNSSSLLRMIDEAGIPYNRRQRDLRCRLRHILGVQRIMNLLVFRLVDLFII